MEILKIKVLFTSIVMLMSHVHGMSQQENDLIRATCKNTPNYELCVSTIRANPKSINANGMMLGIIMVEAVRSKAEETLNAINELKVTRPDLGDALDECTKHYNFLLKTDIIVALDSLSKGLPFIAEVTMKDSSRLVDWCQGDFDRGNSPLYGFNNAVSDLCKVATGVITTLME